MIEVSPNIIIIIRGMYLRLWQRLPKFLKRKIFSIPIEFYNKDNPNVPSHKDIYGLCIGASGFSLHECFDGKYHATQLYYDKWGRIKKREYH